MNVKKLKDFRAKLKRAKKMCARQKYNKNIIFAFGDAGLVGQCAGVLFNPVMPDYACSWYVHSTRTPTEREAMWDNSIRAIDERIAKAK